MDGIFIHWTKRLVYTSGVKALADEFGAYWLVDAISSYLMYEWVQGEEFQVWQLKAHPGKVATLTMTDGNSDKPLINQDIEFTDFPEGEVELYLVGPDPKTLMLPCEY